MLTLLHGEAREQPIREVLGRGHPSPETEKEGRRKVDIEKLVKVIKGDSGFCSEISNSVSVLRGEHI